MSLLLPSELCGRIYPFIGFPFSSAAMLLDATGEKASCIGFVRWADGGSHTIDTSGSSAIGWYGSTGTAVFDDAGSTMDIGLQGIGTGGPAAQPDGTFTVYRTATAASNSTPSMTTLSSWHSLSMVGGTGSKTLADGDPVAVVWDFTNRAGSDAVVITPTTGMPSIGTTLPVCNAYVGGAWGGNGVGNTPNITLTASDGTVGILDFQGGVGTISSVNWSDSNNPDERGLIFQVSQDLMIDGYGCSLRIASASSDGTLSLIENAESSRNALESYSFDAAQLNIINSEKPFLKPCAPRLLRRGIDYCVALRATSTGDVRFQTMTLPHADFRAFFPGGTSLRSVTANGGGNFGSSSTTLMYPFFVRIARVQSGVQLQGLCRGLQL